MRGDGVLVLDKPGGMTSRQVVTRIKGVLGSRKAGHAGTLDPLATGVLVVCAGRATLLSRYLMKGRKSYSVVALLGVETDTYDIEGTVVASRSTAGLSEAEIESSLRKFEGVHPQKPPPYSAVKHSGKPLYHYTRRGIAVETGYRDVTVHSIELKHIEKNGDSLLLGFDVTCAPGTYVRSIVNDLGRSLGCGACVSALRRVQCGRFTEDESVTLDALLSGDAAHAWGFVLSMERATDDLPTVVTTGEGRMEVVLGKPLTAAHLSSCPEPWPFDSVFRVLDEERNLIALYGPPRRGDPPSTLGRAIRVIRPEERGLTGSETT